MATDQEQRSLTDDVLHTVLALRGQSRHFFDEAIAIIRRLATTDGAIYPPGGFPHAGLREPVSTIQPSPDHFTDGRLSEAEAVATLILLNECDALAQSWGKGGAVQTKLEEILGITEDVWDFDVIDGMAGFGNELGLVTGVRERMLSGEGKPKGSSMGDHLVKLAFNSYEQPLKEDNLIIGENTARAIAGVVEALARRDIPNNPEGAKTKPEVQARINGRIKGARLAKDIFLETRSLAAKVVSERVEPRVVNPNKPQ